MKFKMSTFFFDFTAAYTSLALLLIPIFACSYVSCTYTKNGYRSISAVMHKEPLATAFSYFGALWLFVILYYQTQRHNVGRYIAALLAAKFLSVPLIIPLQSVSDNSYHDGFVVAGAATEILYGIMVAWEHMVVKHQNNGAVILYITLGIEVASFIFAGVIFLIQMLADIKQPSELALWSLFVIEFVFGFALVIQSKTIQYFHL
jgi:hypothetical protein